MTFKHSKAALAASILALGLAPPALAQTTGGSSSGQEGRGVSASTWGEGSQTPDSVEVRGGGEATAEDGTARTDSRARVNKNRAMQHSRARARTDDERARSRTHTVVRRDGTIRSRSSSMYRQKGERPVRDREFTITHPDGTVETRGRPQRDD